MEPMAMCHKCRKQVLYTLKRRERTREAYGEKFKYEEEYAECDICGCEIYVPGLHEKNEEKFRALVEKSLLEGKKPAEIVHIEDNLRHEVSELICLKCLYRWVGVYPEKTLLKDIECKCGEVGYVIKTGQTIVDEEGEPC